jgi:hypothetical protein
MASTRQRKRQQRDEKRHNRPLRSTIEQSARTHGTMKPRWNNNNNNNSSNIILTIVIHRHRSARRRRSDDQDGRKIYRVLKKNVTLHACIAL